MFNFFKKKDKGTEPKTTFKPVENSSSGYTPWDTSKRNSNTEFANAVFLNIHTKPRKKPDSPDEYPRYVSYELGIFDPLKKFNDMLSSGMLEVADAAAVLSKMKVTELKEILKEHSLSVSGKKAELVDRIKSEISIASLGLPTMYTVSENGKKYIEEHDDLVKLHGNHYNITYGEYFSAKTEKPELGYNDLVWYIFNEREMTIPLSDNGLRRNNYYCKAEFLKEENRLADALLMFATVLYYDVNIELNAGIEPKDFMIAPALEAKLIELKDHFTDQIIERCFRCDVYPKKMITPEGFGRLLNDVFSEKFKSLKKYL